MTPAEEKLRKDIDSALAHVQYIKGLAQRKERGEALTDDEEKVLKATVDGISLIAKAGFTVEEVCRGIRMVARAIPA